MFWQCRLCAELQPIEGVFDLDKDEATFKDLIVKLTLLNANYVDLSDRSLPRIICFDCYESLSQAYKFLLRVKKAQVVLYPQTEMDVSKNNTDENIDFKLKRLLQSVKEECKSSNNYNYSESVHEDVKHIVTELLIEADPTECKNEVLDRNIKQEMSNIPSTSKPWCPTLRKCLIENKIQTWTEYRWTCGLCYVELPDIATLRSHSIEEHRKCAEFACFICEKVFNFNSFLLHIRNDHNFLKNCCQYCNVKIEPDELTLHINQHLESVHPCPNCGDTFLDETSLQKHLDSLIQKKNRKRRKVKYTVQDRTCPICKKVSWCYSKLRDHMKIHTNDRQRDYVCDLCGKMFYSKGTLKCHLVSHSNERPHVCKECDRAFKKLSNLRKHIETHSSVKPYTCEACGRSFLHKDSLKKHEIIHTDSFPYSCQYCNKGFNFKTCMTKHERQHTGVKPYSCEECSRAFTDWGNFNKHMKRRHNRDMSRKKLNYPKIQNMTDYGPLQ